MELCLGLSIVYVDVQRDFHEKIVFSFDRLKKIKIRFNRYFDFLFLKKYVTSFSQQTILRVNENNVKSTLLDSRVASGKFVKLILLSCFDKNQLSFQIKKDISNSFSAVFYNGDAADQIIRPYTVEDCFADEQT